MLRHRYLAFGLCISCEPIRGASRSLCTTLESLYTAAAAPLGFGFCLDYFCQEQFRRLSVCETPTREINLSSAIVLHPFLFLLVFFDSQARISLLGEVDRATPVDNQRRRGAAIAGFLTELFGSRIELCRDSTKSRVIRTYRKIGNPSSH